jgi:ketosteroid isomerase-like protein
MNRLLAFGLLLAAAPRLQAAQSPIDTVRTLDSAWARAYANHDTSLALALFADDLVVTSAGGVRKTKAEELADVRPYPGLRMRYFRTSNVDVRTYGSVAVVVGLAEWEFTLEGQVRTVRRAYTATYGRGGPLKWRMVSIHLGNAPT